VLSDQSGIFKKAIREMFAVESLERFRWMDANIAKAKRLRLSDIAFFWTEDRTRLNSLVDHINAGLLECIYLPVASIRAWRDHPPYKGWDSQWVRNERDEPFRRTTSPVLKRMRQKLDPLLSQDGYRIMTHDCDVFRRRVRVSLFEVRPVWDYLFYLGEPPCRYEDGVEGPTAVTPAGWPD
jgi:hypothetical protein